MMKTQFPRASNRADWSETLELIDDDTGEVITDLTGVVIRVQVAARCNRYLSAVTSDSHVTTSAFGTVTWTFPASEMSTLTPDTYDVGITLERDGAIEQELIGVLPVYEGVVWS